AVVEICEQEPDLRIVLRPRSLLERPERIARPPGVDRGHSQTFEERGIVRCLSQPLPEQQRRFVRPALAERVPAPTLEAADHVLTPRRARRIVRGGETELLARPRELPGGVDPGGFFSER